MKSFRIYNGKMGAAPGSHIDDAIAEGIELAATPEHGPLLTFEFNSVNVTVAADSDPKLIKRDWRRAMYNYIEKAVGPYPAAELSADDKANDSAKQAENDRRKAERVSTWEDEE